MTSEPRMTWQTRAVLKLLLDDIHGQHYGLEIAEGVGLATGSVYPILARLEQAGWVISEWENIDPAVAGRRRRRYYKLTALGAEKARDHAQGAPTPVWAESPQSGGTTPRPGWSATPGWTSP